MSTLELEHLKHTSSSSNNLSTHSDGSLTVGNLQSLNVLGDLTVDTSTLKVDATNNRVGIGNTNPSHLLKVGPVNQTETIAVQSSGGGAETIMQSYAGTDSRIGSSANTPLNLITNSVSRMTIDTSGRVTMPNQPSFLMKRYSGGATSISNNTVWTFDEALTNVGGYADISNGRFTAPVAGNYCFMWHNIGENSSAVYRSFIRLNASSTWGTGSYRLESRNYHSSGYPNASAQVVVPLAASDYVDIYVTGGNIYSDQTNGAWFCGFLIG